MFHVLLHIHVIFHRKKVIKKKKPKFTLATVLVGKYASRKPSCPVKTRWRLGPQPRSNQI